MNAPRSSGGAEGAPGGAPGAGSGPPSEEPPLDRGGVAGHGAATAEAAGAGVEGDAADDRAADLLRFWYRRHGERVYRYARWRTGSRWRAEEVVSDVFLEAWRSSDAYDPRRGSVESWLLGIARNVLRRQERTRAREVERRGTAALEDLASPRPGPEEEALRRRRVERVLEHVWELPRRDRDLVALAYGAGLSRRRIASLLDMSPEAVRVRLHRALERVRERLGEGDA